MFCGLIEPHHEKRLGNPLSTYVFRVKVLIPVELASLSMRSTMYNLVENDSLLHENLLLTDDLRAIAAQKDEHFKRGKA